MIELSLNPALYLMRKSLMAGGKTLWPSKGIDPVSGGVVGASGVKTIYQRKRVNLHPTRYRRPFSQEKGQFVSKTRIGGPLVSSVGTIGKALPQGVPPKVAYLAVHFQIAHFKCKLLTSI